jgi:hypothetical protein
MEIRKIETSIGETQLRRATQDQSIVVARPDEPVTKQNESSPSRESPRPTQPQRKPAFAQVVTKGLADTGISVNSATAVTSPDAAQKAQSSNDLEAAQSEKVAQALQAFMHSLVQATSAEQGNSPNDTTTRASSDIDPATKQTAGSASAGSAYTGLVGQLENLARELESPAIVSESGVGTSELNSTFRRLLAVSGNDPTDRSTTMPQLQDVIRNIARNLQSTGNPNLATTGNVINTAA